MHAPLVKPPKARPDRMPVELPPRGPQTEHLRPIYVLAALHRKLLDHIAARNYDVATQRIELGPLQKPWTAWRAARRA